MTDLLNFPEQLYVGTKDLRAWDVTDPPLGFATPFGTDKAFETRKSTVDRWCGDGKTSTLETINGVKTHVPHMNDTKPVVIDNVLIEGFEIDRSVSRMSTSNKLFRITDPRGFQLEISTENLADILLNGTVERGRMQGRFIWGRKGTNMFLAREDHPSYVHHTQPAISRPIRPGDLVYRNNKPVELLYVGAYWVYHIDVSYTKRTPEFYSRNPEQVYTNHYDIIASRSTKAVHIFLHENGSIIQANTLPKTTQILSENNPIPASFETENLIAPGPYSKYDLYAFFDTKDALMAFSASFDEMENKFGNWLTDEAIANQYHYKSGTNVYVFTDRVTGV